MKVGGNDETTTEKTAGLAIYHRCPFCPPGLGEVAVDTARIARWLLGNPPSTYDHANTDYWEHPARDTLVFAPAKADHAPCEHLLAMSYSPALNLAAIGHYETTVDYEHSKFRRRDPEPRYDLSCFAFDSFFYDGTTDHPQFGKLVERSTDKYVPIPGVDLDLLLFGYAYFVERPDVFFEVLLREFAVTCNR